MKCDNKWAYSTIHPNCVFIRHLLWWMWLKYNESSGFFVKPSEYWACNYSNVSVLVTCMCFDWNPWKKCFANKGTRLYIYVRKWWKLSLGLKPNYAVRNLKIFWFLSQKKNFSFAGSGGNLNVCINNLCQLQFLDRIWWIFSGNRIPIVQSHHLAINIFHWICVYK